MINNDWLTLLQSEFQKEYYKKLDKFVLHEYTSVKVYPAKKDIFKAFEMTNFQDVKVVILGQDPYHQPNQAHGLSFSVNPGIKIPPSLLNIYKELKEDLQIPIASHGYLKSWAKQGVFLLNTILTVEESKPLSHKGVGWEMFTDEVIRKLNDRDSAIVFILWGRNARSKKELITNKNHLIIESSHPSPLSAYSGFFGSKPFSRTNQFLIKNNQMPIQWEIKEEHV